MDEQKDMEAADVALKPKSLIVRRRWQIILGITAAILVSIGLIHVIQVRHVKHVATSINVGDTREQVIKLLGKPRVTYSTGFPSQGGAATIWGSCYGGLLNSLRSTIDVCVYRVLPNREWPSTLYQFYQKFGAQSNMDWPIVIVFDKGGSVVEVKQ